MEFTSKSLLVCPATHYDVHYEINPWMSVKDRPDLNLAKDQWNQYEATLKNAGASLHYLKPDPIIPDLVFTANHALVNNGRAVLAKMHTVERAKEEAVYGKWFTEQGFETISLDKYSFEGEGDAFIVNDTLFYGYGFRSDRDAAEPIAEFFGLKKIVYCELVDPYFYHLDTCFAPLFDGSAVIFPPAFTPKSFSDISNELELLKVNPEEAKQFACNLVVLDKQVIVPTGCPELSQQLEEKNFKVTATSLTQFLKAGGSAKCLCLRLNQPTIID